MTGLMERSGVGGCLSVFGNISGSVLTLLGLLQLHGSFSWEGVKSNFHKKKTGVIEVVGQRESSRAKRYSLLSEYLGEYF